LKQQKFSRTDPDLSDNLKKLQSDPVVIRPKLASVLIRWRGMGFLASGLMPAISARIAPNPMQRVRGRGLQSAWTGFEIF